MKLFEEVLPPGTAKLFAKLRNEPLLNAFYLIGGTGLALRIGHRLSEDLDFITKEQRLPRQEIAQMLASLEVNGAVVEKITDPIAEEDFDNSGLVIDDYLQNYVVDGTRVTFFAGDKPHAKLLISPLQADGPTLPSLEELQGLKMMVCCFRSKSRDWLDVYILATRHGYTPLQWKSDILRAGLDETHFRTALKRIRSEKTDLDDRGFFTLLPNPPSLQEIAATLTDLAQRAFPEE